MMILSMDLSLNLPSCVVLEINDGVTTVLDTYYVDNKKVSTWTKAEKLFRIQNMFEKIHSEYPLIDYAVREKGFSRFPSVTQALFRVVGVADLKSLELFNVRDVAEIPPTRVKLFIGGYGKASKDEVAQGVVERLREDQKDMEFYSDDVTDAIAVGMTFGIEMGWIK